MYIKNYFFYNAIHLVYNDKEGYLYVHHDILMLHMPLCLTWLDYDAKNADAGSNKNDVIFRYIVIVFLLFLVNYIAVGSMEGVIEIFDVDLVDQLEPLHTFGKKPKKKKSKKASKVCFIK